jgi:hypothetical protein
MFQGGMHPLPITLAQSNSFSGSEKSKVFVSELIVLSSINYSLTLLEGLIPQRSIALEWLAPCSLVFMLKKNTALELQWLS